MKKATNGFNYGFQFPPIKPTAETEPKLKVSTTVQAGQQKGEPPSKKVQVVDPKRYPHLHIPVSTTTVTTSDGTLADDGQAYSPTLSQGTVNDGGGGGAAAATGESLSPKRKLKLENQQLKQKDLESKMRTIETYGSIVQRREEAKKDPDFQTNLFNYAQKRMYEKVNNGRMEPLVKTQILEVDDLLEGIFDVDEANLKRPRRIKKKEAPIIDPNFGKDYVKAMTSKSVQLICDLRRSKESNEKLVNRVLLVNNSEQERKQREKIQTNIELMKQSLSWIQKIEDEKKRLIRERSSNSTRRPPSSSSSDTTRRRLKT